MQDKPCLSSEHRLLCQWIVRAKNRGWLICGGQAKVLRTASLVILVFCNLCRFTKRPACAQSRNKRCSLPALHFIMLCTRRNNRALVSYRYATGYGYAACHRQLQCMLLLAMISTYRLEHLVLLMNQNVWRVIGAAVVFMSLAGLVVIL